MEQSHSLLLNEQVLEGLADAQRPVFVYEWLRYLDRVLPVAAKTDVRDVQKRLVAQLRGQMAATGGSAARALLGRCLATLFAVGDAFALLDTVNACNDCLRARDDTPSRLPARLAAIAIIGALYERLGRMVGRSFEDTTQILLRTLKNAESQTRAETMHTLAKMVTGLGSAGASIHKDVYKAARPLLADRVLPVRVAAARCLRSLAAQTAWLSAAELETVASACFKALDGSDSHVRRAVARLLAALLSAAINPPTTHSAGKQPAVQSAFGVDEAAALLAAGFLRGGSGFLKGSSGFTANLAKEVRVGVALAFVEWARLMGAQWLERNLAAFVRHALDLAAVAGRATTPAAAPELVCVRRCVAHVLRATAGSMLSEKSQTAACKELGHLIAEQMNAIDYSVEAGEERLLSVEVLASQHVLVCALQELGAVVALIDTAATPLFVEASGIMEPVFACLLHPCAPTRLAAAWCLRCVAAAVPSLLAPLIDRCLSRLEHMKSSAEALGGYSGALAALLAGGARSTLGAPHAKGRQVFACAEELLRTAAQSSRLAVARTRAGWLLLAAVACRGPSLARHHLPRMLALWRSAFPRSAKEAEAERTRGDAFTWTLTLEARAGALAAMTKLCCHCDDLLTDDVMRRILAPIDSCLAMVGHMPDILRCYGQQLRTPAVVLRLRLYETLLQIKPKFIEGHLSPLLREMVADITLADSPQSAVVTSQLATLCQPLDDALLGAYVRHTDDAAVEMQLCAHDGAGQGALENDPAAVLSVDSDGADCPEPLPPSVAVVDAALLLYGRLYPSVAAKHRLQMLDHFAECVKSMRAGSPRQLAVHANALAAVLCALRALAERRGRLDGEAVQRAALNQIIGALAAPNPLLRCAAAEALGRLGHVIGDPQFVAATAQLSFDKLKNVRDAASRTGYSLALGCLHRHVGSLGSGQHLNTSVSILLALAQDHTSPAVQVWSLRALALIAETGGPMFRGYVEPTLSQCVGLLLGASAADVGRAVGPLVSALITAVGPELPQPMGAAVGARASFLVAAAAMADAASPSVRAEAVACLQQMHLFAPRHVNLDALVQTVCKLLRSRHLVERKAAVCCLRQLAQREAREVREHAQALAPRVLGAAHNRLAATAPAMSDAAVLPENGLEGALFAMLDSEFDATIRSNVKETLLSLVQATAAEQLAYWLTLCKDILAATSSDVQGLSPDKSDAAAEDEGAELSTDAAPVAAYGTAAPRWPTRVFAVDVVRRLLALAHSERAHLDLALAKELQLSGGKSDYLVLHLSDLIRMAFMASTSDSTELRLAGLACLQEIITKFSGVAEPEFPGHVMLEQFQAQVGAALRPAFASDTPSDVTAAACQVCSTWIGSGVARDLNDLRRVHQLLVSSLAKLKQASISTQLYAESAATLEKLAILKAWAQVYIVAMQQADDARQLSARPSVSHGPRVSASGGGGGESLLSLVTPELSSLADHWIAALRDSALLGLPPEFGPQLPTTGGRFYTPETADACRPHYRRSWPPILLAAATWLRHARFRLPDNLSPRIHVAPGKFASAVERMEPRLERFHLILGVCAEALCSARQTDADTTRLCVSSLRVLFECSWAQRQLMADVPVAVEVLNLLHRLVLTRDCASTHALCMRVLDQILTAAQNSMDGTLSEQREADEVERELFSGEEADDEGRLRAGESLVFAAVEVCLCLLTKLVPGVNPSASNKNVALTALRRPNRFSAECEQLIRDGTQTLTRISALCRASAALVVLPTTLHLLLSVLRETSRAEPDAGAIVPQPPTGRLSTSAAAALLALRTLLGRPVPGCDTATTHPQWLLTARSGLLSVATLADTAATPDAGRVDLTAALLGTAVFLTAAPADVARPTALVDRCLLLFASCIDHDSAPVRLRGLQSLLSVLTQSADAVAAPFATRFGPVCARLLHDCAPYPIGRVAAGRVDTQPAALKEAVRCLEALVSRAADDKKFALLNLLVQTLIEYLHEDGAGDMADVALQRLTELGATQPAAVKRVLAAFPQHKARLESVCRRQQRSAAAASARSADAKPSVVAAPSQPAIALKMDFSGFA